MGEGLELNEGQEFCVLPPLQRLSVIQRPTFDMMQLQQRPEVLHQQLIIIQEKLLKSGNSHPLYAGGICQWIGCETPCQSVDEFLHHLQSYHQLSEKTAAQTKVQMQMVDQLEQQVVKEKARLVAMVNHVQKVEAEKRMGMDIYESTHDILHTNSLYEPHNEDPRPPHTYAALIRMAILESERHQLTLNEIYIWFQTNFAFFKPSTASWKNAIRHNLSLHKCFRRVENIKGSVWMVDEEEFQRRRFQSKTEQIKTSEYSMRTSSAGSSRSCSPYWEHNIHNRKTLSMDWTYFPMIKNHHEDCGEDMVPQDLSVRKRVH